MRLVHFLKRTCDATRKQRATGQAVDTPGERVLASELRRDSSLSFSSFIRSHMRQFSKELLLLLDNLIRKSGHAGLRCAKGCHFC